jgi:hypothetical protein
MIFANKIKKHHFTNSLLILFSPFIFRKIPRINEQATNEKNSNLVKIFCNNTIIFTITLAYLIISNKGSSTSPILFVQYQYFPYINSQI